MHFFDLIWTFAALFTFLSAQGIPQIPIQAIRSKEIRVTPTSLASFPFILSPCTGLDIPDAMDLDLVFATIASDLPAYYGSIEGESAYSEKIPMTLFCNSSLWSVQLKLENIRKMAYWGSDPETISLRTGFTLRLEGSQSEIEIDVPLIFEPFGDEGNWPAIIGHISGDIDIYLTCSLDSYITQSNTHLKSLFCSNGEALNLPLGWNTLSNKDCNSVYGVKLDSSKGSTGKVFSLICLQDNGADELLNFDTDQMFCPFGDKVSGIRLIYSQDSNSDGMSITCQSSPVKDIHTLKFAEQAGTDGSKQTGLDSLSIALIVMAIVTIVSLIAFYFLYIRYRGSLHVMRLQSKSMGSANNRQSSPTLYKQSVWKNFRADSTQSSSGAALQKVSKDSLGQMLNIRENYSNKEIQAKSIISTDYQYHQNMSMAKSPGSSPYKISEPEVSIDSSVHRKYPSGSGNNIKSHESLDKMRYAGKATDVKPLDETGASFTKSKSVELISNSKPSSDLETSQGTSMKSTPQKKSQVFVIKDDDDGFALRMKAQKITINSLPVSDSNFLKTPHQIGPNHQPVLPTSLIMTGSMHTSNNSGAIDKTKSSTRTTTTTSKSLTITSEYVNSGVLSVPGFLKMHSTNDIEILEKISGGSAGTVYRAKLKPGAATQARIRKGDSGDIIAVKMVNNPDNSMFKFEVALLGSIPTNPNVLTLLGYFEYPNGIAMKLYSGTLEKIVYDPLFIMTTDIMSDIARDMALGLLHIHSYGIVHFDIKPSNILVDCLENGKLSCAIADFGNAKLVGSNMNKKSLSIVQGLELPDKGGLTYGYCSPEILSAFLSYSFGGCQEIHKKGDVYSYGISLYEIFCRKKPWAKNEEKAFGIEMEKGNYPQFIESLQNSLDAKLQGLLLVARKTWNLDPEKRPSFSQILEDIEMLN